jgi:hypothetical protein
VGDGQERPYTGELLAAVGGSLAADAGGWRAGRWRRWVDRWHWRQAAGWRHVDGWRRWAAGAAMCGWAAVAVAVAAAGSCESPQDKVAVVVLSLCGHGCQNESSQRANLLRFMLGRSRLL